jgi:MoaD family protein
LEFNNPNSVRIGAAPVEAGRLMRIHVLAFARLREILDAPERIVEVHEGARIDDVWSALAADFPALLDERFAVRAARNGRLAGFDERLSDGDEVALLPPVSGG